MKLSSAMLAVMLASALHLSLAQAQQQAARKQEPAQPAVITDGRYLSDEHTGGIESCATPHCLCTRPGLGGYWINAEYLLWWAEGQALPPLLTTSPPASSGVLGAPGTTVLFGGGVEDNEPLSGGRIDFGMWLDPSESIGAGARFYGVGGDTADFSGDFNEFPVLARPFFNVQTGLEDAVLVASPGEFEGSADAALDVDTVGADSYLRLLMTQGPVGRLDFLAGYQFSRIDNNLSISSLATSIDPGAAVPVGTTFNVIDVFDTENEFHGGQVGFLATVDRRCWTLSTLAKIGLGNMHQTVRIDGSTTIDIPAVSTTTTAGGLLTQPTNIGLYERDELAWVPELNVTLGYRLSECLDVTVGYSMIYWTTTTIAADAVDRAVNPTQFGGAPIIGAARPAFTFTDTDYWLQGISFGLSGKF